MSSNLFRLVVGGGIGVLRHAGRVFGDHHGLRRGRQGELEISRGRLARGHRELCLARGPEAGGGNRDGICPGRNQCKSIDSIRIGLSVLRRAGSHIVQDYRGGRQNGSAGVRNRAGNIAGDDGLSS